MFTPWFKTFIATGIFIALLLCYAEAAHSQTFYICMAQQDEKGSPACWNGEKAISPFHWLKKIAPSCILTEAQYVRDTKQEVSIIKLICIESGPALK